MSNATDVQNLSSTNSSRAGENLLPLVYEELRRLAAAKLSRENPGQTLQATALVHEAWLKIGGGEEGATARRWNSRSHFFATAAEAMRCILIDNARRKKAARHGGGLARADIDGSAQHIAAPAAGNDDELLAVHEALERLAAHDARKAELVKLRYFAGLTIEEAAAALDISAPTAKRDWTFARAWLYREIARAPR